MCCPNALLNINPCERDASPAGFEAAEEAAAAAAAALCGRPDAAELAADTRPAAEAGRVDKGPALRRASVVARSFLTGPYDDIQAARSKGEWGARFGNFGQSNVMFVCPCLDPHLQDSLSSSLPWFFCPLAHVP